MTKKNAQKESFDVKIKNFISRHTTYVYALSLVAATVIIFKLFDIRVNTAGDDSAYILRAFQLVHKGIFPAWQGPLYPMVLSIFIAVFGLSVPLLKVLSAIFLLSSIYILYLALKDRISVFLLMITLFTISLNSFILYYGYFTFSEAFYMLIQAILFLVLFKEISSSEHSSPRLLIFVGLTAFAMYLTRTVGIAGILAVLGYFALQKDFKKLGITFVSFTGFYALFSILEKAIWKTKGTQFSEQLTTLLQKHPYNPSLGQEDFTGLIGRFADNSNLYLSKHFLRFLSLRTVTASTVVPALTIALYAILAVGLIYAFRKNKFVLFLYLYLGTFLLITFISLQKLWDQERLIAPIFPVLVILLGYSLFRIFEWRWIRNVRFVPHLFFIALVFLILGTSGKRISENRTIHRESMKGNQFFGFTPDWENYLRMSEYAGKTTGNDLVACRKPSNSFIYGKKIFKGIYTVPVTYADSVFISGKVYYALMLSDRNVGFFTRNTIKAVFAGVAANQNFKTNKTYYLFEVNQENPNKELEAYKIDQQQLEQSFSRLSIYSPDQLLDNLKKANTKYIIAANLRKNPVRKTGKTVDTVTRYVNIILTKYPNFITKVHEIGNDEKAFLYKINY